MKQWSKPAFTNQEFQYNTLKTWIHRSNHLLALESFHTYQKILTKSCLKTWYGRPNQFLDFENIQNPIKTMTSKLLPATVFIEASCRQALTAVVVCCKHLGLCSNHKRNSEIKRRGILEYPRCSLSGGFPFGLSTWPTPWHRPCGGPLQKVWIPHDGN